MLKGGGDLHGSITATKELNTCTSTTKSSISQFAAHTSSPKRTHKEPRPAKKSTKQKLKPSRLGFLLDNPKIPSFSSKYRHFCVTKHKNEYISRKCRPKLVYQASKSDKVLQSTNILNLSVLKVWYGIIQQRTKPHKNSNFQNSGNSQYFGQWLRRWSTLLFLLVHCILFSIKLENSNHTQTAPFGRTTIYAI